MENEQSIKPFGGSLLPFDKNAMARIVSLAADRISEAKEEFVSKQSFWKWAFGDMRKRLWTGATAFIGAIIWAFLLEPGLQILSTWISRL